MRFSPPPPYQKAAITKLIKGGWWVRLLTLFVAGCFFGPHYVLLENGSKNDKTILPYIFEDLTEGMEPLRPPQPPKNLLFENTENLPENW